MAESAATTATAAADPEARVRLESQAMQDAQDAGASETLWVHSNRKDNRVVIWEPDPRHPMNGEAFVGGDGAVLVARTEQIEAHLRSGELVEIAAPAEDNRRRPLVTPQVATVAAADMPGQPTHLGRSIDPSFEVKGDAQRKAPKEIPVPSGVQMPKEDKGR